MSTDRKQTILVLGATGYVGSRLVPCLLEKGYLVRAAGRSVHKLQKEPWAGNPSVEIVSADVFELDSLRKACAGTQIAYYLVHSMEPGRKDFAEADRKAASHMVQASQETGLKQIIYLAGLGEDTPALSKHLRSRREVEQILKSGKVSLTVFRAAMIMGSGSVSFEILRYLVERLPVMITPRWVSTESQPIAIRNVLYYLAKCTDIPETLGQTFEIGGEEVLNYRRLMEIYAEEAHLKKRWVIPVPVLTPRLSSYWIHLVTPIHASIAKPLAEGLRNKVVVTDSRVCRLIPQKLLSAREAIRLALDPHQYYLMKSDFGQGTLLPPEWAQSADPAWAGGTLYEDRRKLTIHAPASTVWRVISKIGGETGWYYADCLWQLRGWIDQLSGGIGMRKSRSAQGELARGDIIDFWRVEEVEPVKRLLLVAEMKLPGEAVLDFRIDEKSGSETELTQTARFIPRGLGGIAYWFLVLPLHYLIFHGMLRAIGKKSTAMKATADEAKK